MSRKRIYLDYATTTPVLPAIQKEMDRFAMTEFANPASLHTEGVIAKNALIRARQTAAQALHAHHDEIIFTSGGTESNNLAIFGFIEALRKKGVPYKKMHAITSVIEHASVLECFEELEKKGVAVTYIPVDQEGIVSLNNLKKALRPNTVLISIMCANNEIGTIQPIAKIARLLCDVRANNNFPVFHTDASQVPLYLDCSQEKLGVDLMTIDGQKIYGPKGVGILYIRRRVTIVPLFFGGGQEKGLRPGTIPVPLVIGTARALENAVKNQEKESLRLCSLRDYFLKEVLAVFPDAILNGSVAERLPNNINFSFPGIDTEFLVMQLDAAGVACSTKSACKEGERQSHVVFAMSKNRERAASTIRFSLGIKTTRQEIQLTVKILKKILKKS